MSREDGAAIKVDRKRHRGSEVAPADRETRIVLLEGHRNAGRVAGITSSACERAAQRSLRSPDRDRYV